MNELSPYLKSRLYRRCALTKSNYYFVKANRAAILMVFIVP